ncbi:MAG: hypothetical protein RDV48_29245 [Candidatus Eremiobacteraeota bacterium]|nr:hypothetical protein [Candidatus Eremiobacteraeota bacterium]
MRKPTGAEKAFTLAEILVSMCCFSLILVAFTVFFFSSIKNFNALNAQRDVQSNAVMGLDRFARDFKEASKTESDIHLSAPSDTTKNYIYFPSPRDMQGDYTSHGEGTPWSSWILYYLTLDPQAQPSGTGPYVLVRSRLASEPSSVPAISSKQIRGRAVAKNVASFQVTADLTLSPPHYSYSMTTCRAWGSATYDFKVSKNFFVNDLHNF